MRRVIGVVAAAVLGVAVVLALVLGTRGGGAVEGGSPAPTVVRGLVGSEKQAFFQDPRVRAAFSEHGLDVQVDVAGSRDIAVTPRLKEYDFVLPSSAPAAERVSRQTSVLASTTVFSSPMVLASYRPVVAELAKLGIARQQGGRWTFDVAAYLRTVQAGTRWSQIPGNTAYPANKAILVTTTDVRRSNSAAMWAALTGYVANGNAVLSSEAQVRAVLPRVSPLFLGQGYSESSSEGPFEDFLSAGMGKTPVVLAYESQVLDRQLRHDGSITPDMVVLYPTPDVISKHTLVALKEPGRTVAGLLQSDTDLKRLIATFGFRTPDPRTFADTLRAGRVAPPPVLIDVIEPPRYEVLQALVGGIEKQY